jgi:Na+/H+-dicarboxylate symporter
MSARPERARRRIHPAVPVFGYLIAGLALGYAFPANPAVQWIAQSGTWFPKTIVTFATAIIFILMSAALAKTLFEQRQAGRFLLIIVGLYVAMGAVSLLYVSAWIPTLTGLPLTIDGYEIPGVGAWLGGIAATFATVLTEQPLLQILVAATAAGALVGRVGVLRSTGLALIRCSDAILAGFSKLLWYYPIMVGCLAILIPSRFGIEGLAIYGRTSLNLAIVALVWSAAMLVLMRAITKRTWSQLWRYFATVYMVGFGTGSSYDTLPINLLSAERDLGLRPEVARVSIVLGTVLNKNVATMAVLLVTVSTCTLLDMPLSMTEIAILIPPVMILGLESPGIPGGAGVFMSPVVASLLGAPDPGVFVTTFVTLYSGLIPMLATGGNTTDDGFVGAIVNDCFKEPEKADRASGEAGERMTIHHFALPVRVLSTALCGIGFWMMVAPQSRIGLPALRWMADTTFPGEALVGAFLLLVGVTGALGGRVSYAAEDAPLGSEVLLGRGKSETSSLKSQV